MLSITTIPDRIKLNYTINYYQPVFAVKKIMPDNKLIFILGCSLVIFGVTASAKMYKWTDENGKIHYSQTRPPAQNIQRFEELSIANKQKKGNVKCCLAIRKIANQMIIAQTQGATITDLYTVYHPQLGELKEIANYVSHKFELGIEPSMISQMTFDTCLNAGFNLCIGEDISSPRQSSGSGVYINSEGYLLTNHHVVNKCQTIRILPAEQNADLVVSDANIDLAILKTEPTEMYAQFKQDNVNLGEEIIVAGFPYRGELSSGINITTGTVSALAGPKDDKRLIQITAPVQPGNSGGPLLDKNGNLTGIVVSKLNSLYFAQKYKDIPQNINFAIRASYAQAFLKDHDIVAEVSTASEQKVTTDISQQAEQFTVVVECNRGNTD